jgi:para-nitrobenzyl esterase
MRILIQTALIAALASSGASAQRDLIVQTREGLVAGVHEQGAFVWRGIPYAAPPVGELRWRLPQPAARWSGVCESQLTPRCAQPGRRPSAEDCLYLSVFAPSSATAASPLPVAVFLHGGGAFGDDLQYAPQALVAEGLVVVLLEWRLNVFGQLGHPGLTAESGTSGNWGDFDIVAALKWVHHNIERFGGDPERVLIFGQSGGAWKVATMLASNLARGTFSRAAMESQAVDPGQDRTLADSETMGVDFAAGLGCTGTDAEQVACLRALPVGDLVQTDLAATPLLSTIDGVLLREGIAATMRRRGAGVPLIIGSTHDELSLDLRSLVDSMTVDDYVAAVAATFPNLYPQVLALYPPGPDPLSTFIAVDSDRLTCKVRRFAAAAASAEEAQPVHRYFLTHGFAGNLYGAYHGIDLDLVFAHWGEASYQGAYDDTFAPSAADLALAAQYRRDLARFAADGDPNATSAVPWPAFSPANDNFLDYGDPIAMGAHYQNALCDLLDSRFK